MFIIPGWLIALATFPGIIIHEAAHLFFCKRFKVAVFDVCFFRIENPAGYVIHEPVNDFYASFFISLGPFILNSLLCCFFCAVSFIPVMELDIPDVPSYILFWLGISIGMHSIPSNQDVAHLWEEARSALSAMNPLAIISFPLVVLVFVVNLLRFFWADLFYAMGIGVGLPLLVLNFLA